MKISFSHVAAVVFLALLPQACTKAPSTEWRAKTEKAEFLHRSVKQVTDVIVHDIFSPPVAGRIYLYVGVAAYEAAMASDSTYVSLAGQLNELETLPKPPAGDYSPTLAASEAVLAVGRTLVFSEDKIEAFRESFLAEFRSSGIPDDAFERSVAFGDSIAAHIVRWSAKDNYKQSRSFPKYSIPSDASAWKPTPPAYMDGIEPHWNKIRTAVMDSAAQFKPEPCYAFSVKPSSDFYKEAMETYTIGNTLDVERKEIAAFWDCNPFVMNVKGHVMFATKKISPAGHWMNIVKVTCQQNNLGPTRAAEAYALAAIAMSEGFISCWDEKYRSKLIRPETYINQYIDEDWVPFLQTPPFPEYTSGHSVISNAACVVLSSAIGDNVAFVDSTEVEFGMPVREFTSFRQAADEATISRLYGGIHYRRAVVEGAVTGTRIGEFVRDNVITKRRPAKQLAWRPRK